MGELRYNIPCTKPGGKPSITLESTNGKWQSVTSVDFGGADVSFSGKGSVWSESKTLSSVTNGTITNTDGGLMFYEDSNLTTFGCSLPNLESGSNMFYNSKLSSWNAELPNLTYGPEMFHKCRLTSWSAELPKLENGYYMFSECPLSSWNAELPNLMQGTSMFDNSNLTSWTTNLPLLISGTYMFYGCASLTSFSADIPMINEAGNMFSGCSSLQTFSANCEGIINYNNMFKGDTALTDVQMIVAYIKAEEITASDLGISGCPATAHTYSEWVNQNQIKMTFTSNYSDYIVIADGGYNYFLTTNDTENNTTTLTF